MVHRVIAGYIDDSLAVTRRHRHLRIVRKPRPSGTSGRKPRRQSKCRTATLWTVAGQCAVGRSRMQAIPGPRMDHPIGTSQSSRQCLDSIAKWPRRQNGCQEQAGAPRPVLAPRRGAVRGAAQGSGLAEPLPRAQTETTFSAMAMTAVLRRMGRGVITTHRFCSTFRDCVAKVPTIPVSPPRRCSPSAQEKGGSRLSARRPAVTYAPDDAGLFGLP